MGGYSINTILIKKLFLGIFILIFYLLFINNINSKAEIKNIGNNTYTITSGEDFYNLLSSNTKYWSKNNPTPREVNIKILNNITIPSSSPGINKNIKKTNIDFQNNTYYVKSTTGSEIDLQPDDNINITISNLKMEGKNIKSNSTGTIPSTDGKSTTTGYYTTYYGILFSGKYGKSSSVTNNKSIINYHNIYYNFPNDLTYNQPLTSYYTPINFTGNNYIRTSNGGQQLGEMPNIKVSSGVTTLRGGGDGNFSGAMIYPWYNYMNNSTFPIDVSKNASLNMYSDADKDIIDFIGNSNKIIINNDGNLNIVQNGNDDVFNTSKGIELNANDYSNTNIRANKYNAFRYFFNANLSKRSKTSLVSVKKPFFSSNNGGNFNINSGARLVTYSNPTPLNAGLINNSYNSINFNFIGASRVFGFQKKDITNIPTNANSYDEDIPKANDQQTFTDTIQKIANLTNSSDSGMLISNSPLVNIKSSEKNLSNEESNVAPDKLKDVIKGDQLQFNSNIYIKQKSINIKDFIFNQTIPSTLDDDSLEVSFDSGKTFKNVKEFSYTITNDNGQTKDISLNGISGNPGETKNIIVKGTVNKRGNSDDSGISLTSSFKGTGDFNDYKVTSNLLKLFYDNSAIDIKVNPFDFGNLSQISKNKKINLVNNNIPNIEISDNRREKSNVKLYIKQDDLSFKKNDDVKLKGEIYFRNKSLYNNYVCVMNTNNPKNLYLDKDIYLKSLEDYKESGDYSTPISWKLEYE